MLCLPSKTQSAHYNKDESPNEILETDVFKYIAIEGGDAPFPEHVKHRLSEWKR